MYKGKSFSYVHNDMISIRFMLEKQNVQSEPDSSNTYHTTAIRGLNREVWQSK